MLSHFPPEKSTFLRREYCDWEYPASQGYTASPTSKAKQNKPKTDGNLGTAWSHDFKTFEMSHLYVMSCMLMRTYKTVQDGPTMWVVFRLDTLYVGHCYVPETSADGVQGVPEMDSRHISFSGF